MAFTNKPKKLTPKAPKPAKFKKVPRVETPRSVGPLPADFSPMPSPRDNEELTALLSRVGALHMATELRPAWVAALTDEDYAEVWAWARAVDWVMDPECTVHRSALGAPECMRDVIDPELQSVNIMIDQGVIQYTQLLDEEETAAPVTETPAPDAPAPAPDATGQLPLVQEPPAKPITALRLETPEQVRAVAKALDRRITKLNELAKKNREEGKESEAKSIEREVTMIRESLTSQLRTQGALAFNEGETLVQAVARLFQGEFRSRVRGALLKNVTAKKGESYDEAKQRRLAVLDDMESLIGKIGDVGSALVVEWLSLVADRAYHKGTVAHGAAPSSIAREALQAFEIERQGREE